MDEVQVKDNVQVQNKLNEVTDDEKKVKEHLKKTRYNRKTRRNRMKRVHHNVYTKKYSSLQAKEASFKIFLGNEGYIQYKRTNKLIDKLKKQGKNEKEIAKEIDNFFEEFNKKKKQDNKLFKV